MSLDIPLKTKNNDGFSPFYVCLLPSSSSSSSSSSPFFFEETKFKQKLECLNFLLLSSSLLFSLEEKGECLQERDQKTGETLLHCLLKDRGERRGEEKEGERKEEEEEEEEEETIITEEVKRLRYEILLKIQVIFEELKINICEQKDKEGRGLLHISAKNCDSGLLSLLLGWFGDFSLDFLTLKNGENPLSLALGSGLFENVTLIRDHLSNHIGYLRGFVVFFFFLIFCTFYFYFL